MCTATYLPGRPNGFILTHSHDEEAIRPAARPPGRGLHDSVRSHPNLEMHSEHKIEPKTGFKRQLLTIWQLKNL